MNRTYSFLVVLLSITIQFVFSNSVSLIVTTNVHGEVDPCGWPKKPLGGLARKATVIDELKENGTDPIILDAGNLFFKKKTLDPGVTTESAKINAEIIVDSYNAIGCHAFSPGVNDFALGFKQILSLQEEAKFDFISSNITYHNNPNKLIFKPYKIIKRNKKNIAIIGLTSIFASDEISFITPYDALRNIINEVESLADFIILLFDGKDQDLNYFYTNSLNIDLIIKSNNSGIRSSDGGGKIPTFIIGNRGKVLYDFTLEFNNDEMPFVDVAWCNNSINRINSRLEKMKKGDLEVDLNQLYKNDPTTLNRIKNYNKQLDKAEYLLSNAINTITFEKIELNKAIFDKPSILKIIDAGKLKIKDLIGPDFHSTPDDKGRLPGDAHYNHGH